MANQRLIWAINPFDERDATRARVLARLRELSDRGATIEPVYVLSPDEYEANVSFNAHWLKHIQPTAENVLAHSLRDVKIAGMQPPQIIVEMKPSVSRAVKTLIAYANRKKADAIVVGTHSKNALSRFLLGSFAETLLLYSNLPILVVGAHPNGSSGKILFPTDFGRNSETTFKRVLRLATSQRPPEKVTLFHRQAELAEALVQSGVYLLSGGLVSFPTFLTAQEGRKRKIAARWIQSARKHGIDVDAHWGDDHQSTAQAIVEQAELDHSDYIVMAAQSGPLASTFIGSITRQVVRTAPCPVWVMRNK